MKLIIQFIVLMLVMVVAAIVSEKYFYQITYMESHSKNNSLQVIGWIPNWDQNTAFESYASHVSKFQYISVFWYELDADGTAIAYPNTNIDPAIISYTHDHNEKIFALVANLTDSAGKEVWDAKRVEKVISTEKARQKHIATLLRIVKDNSFDGIDIDYESLPTKDKENFTLFIQELSQTLHENNKLLGVAIYPPDGNSVNGNFGAGAQDLPALSVAADQLYFMTYLQHTISSDPGPTGGIDWMQTSITYAINSLHIPANKIFIGVGLMGTAWRQDPDGKIVGDTADLTFEQIYSIVGEHHLSVQWDPLSQSPHVEFSDQNGRHIIWFENSKSVAQKILLAKKLRVRGIAFWRLGGEDATIWNLL